MANAGSWSLLGISLLASVGSIGTRCCAAEGSFQLVVVSFHLSYVIVEPCESNSMVIMSGISTCFHCIQCRIGIGRTSGSAAGASFSSYLAILGLGIVGFKGRCYQLCVYFRTDFVYFQGCVFLKSKLDLILHTNSNLRDLAIEYRYQAPPQYHALARSGPEACVRRLGLPSIMSCTHFPVSFL